MYKFTNGLIVYDEKTKDEYVKTGMKLVKKSDDLIESETDNITDVKEKHNKYSRQTKRDKEQDSSKY